jgi:hypothetical protein
MTTDDMETIVDYYLRDCDPKDVVDMEGLNVRPSEVRDFLIGVARYVEHGIGVGSFDE